MSGIEERFGAGPFLPGTDEMRTAIGTFDWAATPVGPIDGWSNSLRNIVNLIVNSRHPMFLWWGPQLVQFYNDAYRRSLGDRHPAAFGAFGREFWSEIWPTIGPQIEGVMERGESTWHEDHLVPIFRNGRMEEVYWTYGYSPVWDDHGSVGGTLVVVQEQTARVLAARRVRTVRDLASTGSAHRTEAEAWLAGFDVLSSNPHDLPFVLGFAVSADGAGARVVAQRPLDVAQERILCRELDLASPGLLGRVVATGRPETLHDVRGLVGAVVLPPWPEAVTAARLIPIRRPRSSVPYGILVVGLCPRLPFDEAYADFLSMAADQLANAIANAHAHEEEQRLVEAHAQLSARFREMLEQAPTGVAVFSGPDHRFELANPIYRAITHRSDLIGRRLVDVFPEVVGTDLPEVFDRVYRTGESFAADEYRVALDRSDRGSPEETFYSFRLAPARDEANVVSGLIVVIIDVTAAVRARRELEHTQARLDFTLNAAGVGYWDMNIVTHEANCSLRHYQILGYEEPPTGWTFENFLSHVVPDERDGLEAAVKGSVATGRDFDIECQVVTAGGAHRWVHAHGRVEHLEGKPARLMGILHDVTERRELLAREQAARRTAEHASHAKDQFLATLSHELRTPMNTIIGWTELLAEGGLTAEDAQAGLETIHRHAHVQARMIEDLLDMGRIVSGKIQLTPRLVLLAQIIDGAVDAIAHAARARAVTVTIERTVDQAHVDGDATLLQQVFWNLLGNAVKFTPAHGTVTVTLDRAGSMLKVCVRDTGEGIASDFLPHVFDRFRQADGTSTRAHGGLGIGLSIVKQLVEAHGGAVQGDSDGPGCGTLFTVWLPEAAARPGLDALTVSSDDPVRVDPASPERRLNGARILVVEDDRDARQLIQRILTGAKANVVTAESAAEALGALSHQRFDLLVSDIGMPHEDGYELIRKVRSLHPSHAATLPALALTAYGRPEDRQSALEAGFQMHVAKPIEQARLLQACASLLRAAAAE